MSGEIGYAVLSIFLLIIVAAFFSAAETGLTAASRARLNEIEKRGSTRARTALRLLEAPERLIGALLLGNNLANITSSAVATAALIKMVGARGGGVGSPAVTGGLPLFSGGGPGQRVPPVSIAP